jgi:serine protease AprX
MAGINRRTFLLFLVFLFCFSGIFAQNKKYIVYFKNKNNTPYSISDPLPYLSPRAIQRRQKQNIPVTINDLPVTPAYVDSLTLAGAQVVYTLKWLNAAAILADSIQMLNINTLSFVNNSSRVARKMTVKSYAGTDISRKDITKVMSLPYGNSYTQVHMLEVDDMHNDGFHGEGMLMALLDAGFKNASSLSYLNHLYTNNRVLATYDFVDHEINVYDEHEHGLETLSTIAAYEEGAMIGTAYNASFVLLRTEDVATETEIEEVYWAKGAEYADSIGADIISSSLGYTTFDVPSTNHTYQDMDGNTTISARAADFAASKGILVLISAGNEGLSSWQHISTPADADSALAIGAVDGNMNYASFSSIGPSYDGRIKPDLAADGVSVTVGSYLGGYTTSSGTSFACPLTAGLAAGIWQAFPSLTNMQVADALKKSATQYTHPDNYLGYGIPRYLKAKEYINDSIFKTGIEFRVFPNPLIDGNLSFVVGSEYFNQPVTIKVYDILGRLVAEDNLTVTSLKTETSINSNSIRAGVYVLRFYFPDKIIKTKILKY